MEEFNMYADVKVTVWQRIKLYEGKSVTKEKIIEAVKKGGPGELWELEDTDPSWETIIETEEYIKPEDNDGNSTVELYNDKNELLWENGNGAEIYGNKDEV